MSTFMGRVDEFPDIQIDYFRRDSLPSPLACFLSHVHSDHLAGLATLRSPFVYCSAATKQILLRLETYACRINYAKGILEAQQQTYKHLKKILKPLPLDTPTCLELRPGLQVQVTLFDANHCPGAVMFLIESASKAILYTGDIRSEPWFVNSLVRNPNLIEYASGIRRLDKIYLDTSFTQDIPFQTKAEGIAELLRKVARYPSDTIFHLQAWTYGYEEVWVALSRVLKSPIHVDDYKLRIYNSLKIRQSDDRFSGDVHLSPEAPALVGYMSGNTPQPGCLTSDCNVRLHSCERGNMCAVARGPNVVRIQPVIAHLRNGADLAEVGAGGGGGDLEREAELDLGLMQDIQTLTEMISKLQDKGNDAASIAEAQKQIIQLALESINRRSNIPLHVDAAALDSDQSSLLDKTIKALAHRADNPISRPDDVVASSTLDLPRVIRFPYSRHSSYPELCHLLEAFRPVDVWPCTVSETQWREQHISISLLFGKYCSGNSYIFDETILNPAIQKAAERETQAAKDTQVSLNLAQQDGSLDEHVSQDRDSAGTSQFTSAPDVIPMEIDMTDLNAQPSPSSSATAPAAPRSRGSKRGFDDYDDDNMEDDHDSADDEHESQQGRGFTSSLSTRYSIAQRESYYNMLEYMNNDVWTPIGLMSTGNNHTEPEKEL